MGTIHLSSLICILNVLPYSGYDYFEKITSLTQVINFIGQSDDKNNSLNQSFVPEIPPEMKYPLPGAPIGYGPVKNTSSKTRSKAFDILKKIKRQELTFGYLEKFSDLIDGKKIEYIAKVEAHYDNHPKVQQNPDEPPYWHIGVSIYEKN